MNDTRVDGRPRTTTEQDLYIRMRPCPQCGCESSTTVKYGTLDNSDLSKATHCDRVACDECGLERRFIFLYPAYDLDGAAMGGPEPSEIIAPHEFLAYCDQLRERVAESPDALEYLENDRARSALFHLEDCAPELLKFIPEGAAAIPVDSLRTEAARAAVRAQPERYTRAYLESLVHDLARLREIYNANIPVYLAQSAAHEAAHPPPPPPKPPAFSKASLEAHRLWARRKSGSTAGERLEVTDGAHADARLAAHELSGSRLTRVELARADLGMASAHHVEWTDVQLIEARLGSAALHGSQLTRCDFTRASMGLAKLGDSRIDACRFERANLDRSSWYRSDVTGCAFDGAVFGQAAFDHAVFVDCSFRGASLAMDRQGVMGTMFRAWFYRCDFRDVDWTARDLEECVFIDCLFGGARGAAQRLHDCVLFRCRAEPGAAVLDVAPLAGLLSAERVRDPDGVLPRANLRRVIRHQLIRGEPGEVWLDEHSPLIVAEHARDPATPFPVPFSVQPPSATAP